MRPGAEGAAGRSTGTVPLGRMAVPVAQPPTAHGAVQTVEMVISMLCVFDH